MSENSPSVDGNSGANEVSTANNDEEKGVVLKQVCGLVFNFYY